MMSLPKLKKPEGRVKLPKSGEVVRFRPFTLGDEKIIAEAVARIENMPDEEAAGEIFDVIVRIVKDCIVGDAGIVDSMHLFELAYVFFAIRTFSVGDKIGLNLKCKKCGEQLKVNMSVNDIEFVDGEVRKEFEIETEVGDGVLILSVPKVSDFLEKIRGSKVELYRFIMDTLVIGETVYDLRNKDAVSDEELEEFIESFTPEIIKTIEDFANSIPRFNFERKLKCMGCGEENEFKVENIMDFFIFQ